MPTNESQSLPEAGTKHPRLNWLNFTAADVSDSVGPFVSTYLLSTSHWNESSIGLFLLTLNLATVFAQTPAGWLIDRTRFKRYLTACAALMIAVSITVPAFATQVVPVLLAAGAIGLAAAFIPPAISAITLGIVGPSGLSKQVGTNQAFNHAGNVVAAIAIGLLGSYVVPWGFAPVVFVLATSTAVIVLFIPERSIDHIVARGGIATASHDHESTKTKGAYRTVYTNKPLLVFMLCAGLFHFSNAAMLPLAGQKLAINHKDDATFYVSICIIVAQVVMIGVAMFIGKHADKWGRKRFLLIGFASLPLRGLLFSQVSDPSLIISGQILDGIGAGIYSVIIILVVADLTRGTGIFNFASGVVITVQGLGASFGSWLGEWWAGAYGYSASYAMLTALGVLALCFLAVFMPETHIDKVKPSPWARHMKKADPK